MSFPSFFPFESHRHDTPLTFLALAPPRRDDLAVLGADATSVVISLPQRAVPRRTLPRRAVPRRSTRLQCTATASREDDRDPDMPELGERGKPGVADAAAAPSAPITAPTAGECAFFMVFLF